MTTALKAGREMDALVAERVLGWTKVPGGFEMNQFQQTSGIEHWTRSDGPPVLELPLFSSDVAAAYQAQEALDIFAEQTLFGVELIQIVSAQRKPDQPLSLDDICRLAYATAEQRCLAALRAKGVDV